MTSRLLQDIIHTGDYNNGGINEVYLLDIRDFATYRFRDDKLFDSCYVEKITASSFFIELGSVDESLFTESLNNGLYRQELSTFVRTVEANKTSDFLKTGTNKYLVAFRNTQNKVYCFGSDGGASLTYALQSGKVGEVTGYQITLTKDSIYPLFELNPSGFNTLEVLGSENSLIIKTEDGTNTIKV